MTSARRPRETQKADLSDLQWDFLNDELPEDDPRAHAPETKWRVYELHANATLGDNRPIVDELWKAYGGDVVAGWVERQPGTRPSLWWVYDAPRLPPGTLGAWDRGEFPAPRRRLGGGKGVPRYEVEGYVPDFRCGVPQEWRNLDPDDPPVFEAQAVYLHRHGLLLPAERRRLSARDFEPERIAP